ncbi:GtrA family protein [Sphingomonas sabuli]|uniref:GtrA family protein n=1 Tax=Sphingomonas sabuli TaxID=2764186 RepID=A0A7G9KZI9_9SPHN|nr:GtrA family protein [Sphingomonas sabuli]QNM81788.1 GtrA family protein [Sphingomonas sabuli]
MITSLHPDRRAMLAQLVRFGVTGAFVTALGIGVYVLVVRLLDWHPQVGNVLAYVTAMATGYLMHSKWSFRDHGGERTHATKGKFLLVSLISYALNAFWVWLFFTRLQMGDLAPIVPMLFVTPLVTFVLNRQWVFR